MAENTEFEPVLVSQKTVAPGTTHNGGLANVAVINNRKHPVKVDIWELRPSPPPPKCHDVVSDGYCEGNYLECQLPNGHSLYHSQTISGVTVFWMDHRA